MKKLRSFLLIFLFLQAILLFHSAPQVFAQAKEGQKCNNSGINTSPELRCASNLFCNTDHPDATFPEFLWFEGICVAREAQPCTCQNEGQSGTNKNGFVCGGKTLYCDETEHACVSEKTGAPLDHDKVNFKGQDDEFESDILTGVACVGITETKANCTCQNPGDNTDDKNGFDCTLQSDSSVKGSATCASGNACVKVDASQIHSGEARNQSGKLFEKSVTMYGITCKKPVAECTCDSGDGNGFSCTLNGKTEKDTCDSDEMKCVNQPGNILSKGEGTEKNVFDEADLQGILCEAQNGEVQEPIPTLVSPPPPPCKTEIAAEGGCSAIQTAFGELSTSPSQFITRLFALLLSFSGGIALLLIIRAGYRIMTSQGKPEGIQQGRDEMVAAVVGLLFLIFSFVILQVIGVDILKIPEFGGAGSSGNPQTAGSSGSQPAAGGACDPNKSNQCPSGQTCRYNGSSGQCQALLREGADCTIGVAGQCAAGLTCKYNGSGGTCQK